MRRNVLLGTGLVLTGLLLSNAANASGPGTALSGGPLARPQDVPAATASGSGFAFYGSGYGHGLGMSQWGAHGLARKGWSYRRILTHFYRGTAVTVPAHPVKKVRIEITYDRKAVHLTARVAPVRLVLDDPKTGTVVGNIPVGRTWTVRSARDGFAVRDAGGALVGGHSWGGPVHHLLAIYRDRGGRVFVPEADAIWHRGFTYADGYLEFDQYGCPASCRERVVLPIAFERYLRGIGEMPSTWPMDALRSQAVAARTYATYSVVRNGLRPSCNCHLTDGANDQTYVGFDKVAGAAGARWAGAVTSTARQVVASGGRAIQAFFAASDGGHSESVEDAWHGGNPAYAVSYLRAVCDPGEFAVPNPWTRWRYGYSPSEVTSRLRPYTGSIGTVTAFPGTVRGDGGRIIRTNVRGGGGKATVSGTQLRAALGLPDDRVWINRDRNILGEIRLKYDNVMCGPGLPTTGAASLPGGSRQRFKIGAIYRNRGADVTVWLKGPVDNEYLAAGGATGRLGLPTSDVTRVGRVTGRACDGCRRVTFARGRIYYKTGIGAHALWGPVLGAYLGHDGATGTLGFPTTRVRIDGNATASASFEHGHITCPSTGPCRVT